MVVKHAMKVVHDRLIRAAALQPLPANSFALYGSNALSMHPKRCPCPTFACFGDECLGPFYSERQWLPWQFYKILTIDDALASATVTVQQKTSLIGTL
jgi:hypothetical protein